MGALDDADISGRNPHRGMGPYGFLQLLALSAQANPDKTATVNATLQGVRDVFSVHRDCR